MQFLVQQNEKHVVCNVELVILHFIIWAPVIVLALPVLMVTATIFEASSVDS
jgi:hypothetical protein